LRACSTFHFETIFTDVLKKYNPNLFGYSIGTSSPSVWEIARLNIAMPGGHSSDMPGQARQLVQLLQSHSEVRRGDNALACSMTLADANG
jgi:hypothetical protein